MSQLSLRAQFLIGILFCVVTTLALMSLWSMWADERIEQGLLGDVLQTNLQIYSQFEQRYPDYPGPLSDSLHFYRPGQADFPAVLSGLKPGSHAHIMIDERICQVLVADLPSGRVYLVYDITDHEGRVGKAWIAFYLILAVTLVFVLLTANWVSRGILAPVTALAERLSRIDPRERNVRIAGEFSRHELASIASSVDRFLERLDGFVEREQSFTATASHELRTPLAVIQGATELLTEQTRERPAAQNALIRIRRAAAEMSEFLQALLMLSRESQVDTEPGEFVDVSEIMRRVVDDQRELLNDRPVRLDCSCSGSLRVQAPKSLVTIVLSNLFRNAVAHTERGSIDCELQGRTLLIRDSGAGIAAEHIKQVFDRNFTTRPGGYGMGLYLCKRICDRYGWQIALDSTPAGTTASVTF